MGYKNNLKGSVTESAVKTLLEDVGYRVVPLGMEQVVREVIMLDKKEYGKLGLPEQLRTLPDFLVTNENMSESWLLEVKYRRRWDKDTVSEIGETITNQAASWNRFMLMMFLSEPDESLKYGGKDIPSNHCRLFEVSLEDGKLQYYGGYDKNSGPFPWKNAEWKFGKRVSQVFEGLDKKIEEKTIKTACDLIRSCAQTIDA